MSKLDLLELLSRDFDVDLWSTTEIWGVSWHLRVLHAAREVDATYHADDLPDVLDAAFAAHGKPATPPTRYVIAMVDSYGRLKSKYATYDKEPGEADLDRAEELMNRYRAHDRWSARTMTESEYESRLDR